MSDLLESFIFLEKAMAPHSSTLAWKIPWTGDPGGLQSMGSLRVGCDWATSLSLFTFMHWRRKWQPAPVFLPGESQGWGGAWWAAISGVAPSRTWLKRLSSSSSSSSSSSFIPSWSLLALPWFLTPVLWIFLCRTITSLSCFNCYKHLLTISIRFIVIVFLVAIISVDRFYCSFPPCFLLFFFFMLFSYGIFVSILCQLL